MLINGSCLKRYYDNGNYDYSISRRLWLILRRRRRNNWNLGTSKDFAWDVSSEVDERSPEVDGIELWRIRCSDEHETEFRWGLEVTSKGLNGGEIILRKVTFEWL
ncbi:MAG: hypothetical protein ACTS4V_01505 [Candidatus Hodgkinia cicadicola]